MIEVFDGKKHGYNPGCSLSNSNTGYDDYICDTWEYDERTDTLPLDYCHHHKRKLQLTHHHMEMKQLPSLRMNEEISCVLIGYQWHPDAIVQANTQPIQMLSCKQTLNPFRCTTHRLEGHCMIPLYVFPQKDPNKAVSPKPSLFQYSYRGGEESSLRRRSSEGRWVGG